MQTIVSKGQRHKQVGLGLWAVCSGMGMFVAIFLISFQFKTQMEGFDKANLKEVLKDLEDKINAFHQEWEYYCYPDKTDLCREKVDALAKEIDRLETAVDDNNKKKQRAKLLYLKGKILDLLPTYEKLADECLNKSIKLNPMFGDCWNTYAHVLFKKGDIEGAQKAVKMALELVHCQVKQNGNNKVSLRYQSVLLRSQGKNEQQRKKNIEESLKVIKGAIMLDLKDAATWYFLGNAYFSNFVANFKKYDQLQNAIKAYNKAEQYFKHKYPDLYLNRANVEAHIENYQSAINDYRTAHEIDKEPLCLTSIEAIRKRMQLTKQAFERAGELKAGKLQELVKNIPNSISNNKDNLQLLSISKLKLRYNPKSLLTGKIFARISNYKEIPFSYLAIDHEGSFFTLSLYNVDTEKVDQMLKKDALISVLHPQAVVVSFQGFTYTSVQIFEPIKLRINDTWLSKEAFNPAELRNETFEK